MGQELQPRTPRTPSQRPDPSWSAVAGTTVRLWLERHHIISQRPGGRRRRLVVVLSALVAMALGAGITLAFTGTNQQTPSGGQPSDAAQSMTPLQQATAYQLAAAKWVMAQVSAGVIVGCDPVMCHEAQVAGFPAGQLFILQPTAPDPLGGLLVIATQAIRNQFGTRLASLYAPLVIARFGSGPEEVDVRYIPPGGVAGFGAQQAADLKGRVQAGQQLSTNSNLQIGSVARAELRAGQVDPRLLATLGILTHEMVVRLVAFDVSSPGVGSAIPLRGALIGAKTPGGLATILAVLGQQTNFAPAQMHEIRLANGQSVVMVRYGAPSPVDSSTDIGGA